MAKKVCCRLDELSVAARYHATYVTLQDPRGGLVDKPGKTRDFYHTCYALSGLSVAQHPPGNDGDDAEPILVGGEVNLLVSPFLIGKL